MRILPILSIFLSLFLLSLINFPKLINKVYADTSPLIFTKLLINPTICPDTSCEFIEIKNVSNEEINLSNWELNGTKLNDYIISSGKSLTIARELIDDNDTDLASYEAIWGDNSGVWGDNYKELYNVVEDSDLGISISLPNTSGSLELSSIDQLVTVSWENGEIGYIYDNSIFALKAIDSEDDLFSNNEPVSVLVNDMNIINGSTTTIESNNMSISLKESENINTEISFDIEVLSSDNSTIESQSGLENNFLINLKENGLYTFNLDFKNTQGDLLNSFTFNIELKRPLLLHINEVLPDPDQIDWNEDGIISDKSDEWIEFYNPNTETLNLNNYTIEDKTEKTKNLPNITIPAKEYFVIFSGDINISLNNSDECLYLYNSTNEIIDEFCYSHSEKDKSIIISEGKAVIANPTPGEENKIPDDISEEAEAESDKQIEDYKEYKIIKLDNATDEENIKISGIVTSKTGLLGKNIIYIQDDTGGVMIKVNQVIEEENNIEVFGKKMTDSKGNIYVEAIKIYIGKPAKAIKSTTMKIDKITPKISGNLVTIVGSIKETSGKTFWVTDSTGEKIKVRIKDSTDIDLPRKRVGDSVKITGILSIDNYNKEDNKYEYVIYPRYNNDVIIKNNKNGGKVLAATGLNIYLNIFFSVILLLITIRIKRLCTL